MASRALTAADVAACAGMSADTRRRWVERHGQLDSGPFGEHDVIETAVAAALTTCTTTQRAPRAFGDIRPLLREVMLAGGKELWAVVPQRFSATLVTSAEAAAAAAAAAAEPAWLIQLDPVIEQARRRLADCKAGEAIAEVRSLAAARRSRSA